MREELSLDREPLRLAAVDWAPNDREGDKLLFVFDCGPLGEDEHRIQLDGVELDRWEWVGRDRLDDYLIPRLARRVGSLMSGSSEGGAYFEHGIPFPGSALVWPRLPPRSWPRGAEASAMDRLRRALSAPERHTGALTFKGATHR